MYRRCRNCGANIDCGEICSCLTDKIKEVNRPIFDKILKWAAANTNKYPALAELREEKVGPTTVLKLDVEFGKKFGLILTFDEAVAKAFRAKDYAAVIIKNAKASQEYIEKYLRWSRKQGKVLK